MLPTLFAVACTFHPLFHMFVEEGRPTQLIFGWVFLALAGARPLVDDPRGGSIRLLVLGLWGSFICFWFNGFFVCLLLVMVWLAAARGREPAERRALLLRGAGGLPRQLERAVRDEEEGVRRALQAPLRGGPAAQRGSPRGANEVQHHVAFDDLRLDLHKNFV